MIHSAKKRLNTARTQAWNKCKLKSDISANFCLRSRPLRWIWYKKALWLVTQTRSRKIGHCCRRHELSAGVFPTRFVRKPFQFSCYFSYRDTVNAIWNCLVFPKRGRKIINRNWSIGSYRTSRNNSGILFDYSWRSVARASASKTVIQLFRDRIC